MEALEEGGIVGLGEERRGQEEDQLVVGGAVDVAG